MTEKHITLARGSWGGGGGGEGGLGRLEIENKMKDRNSRIGLFESNHDR